MLNGSNGANVALNAISFVGLLLKLVEVPGFVGSWVDDNAPGLRLNRVVGFP